MIGQTTYDRQLRTIGQSLEAQRIQLFELTRQGRTVRRQRRAGERNLTARDAAPVAKARAQ